VVAADARHPPDDVVRPGWSIAVPLQDDELLSSWLVRAAMSQGCDPMSLTGSVWPRWRAWCRDLDRGLSEDRVEALARAAGLPTEVLRSASLRPIVQTFATVDVGRSPTWPWVLAQGTRGRRRYGGLQYCFQCLREDAQPYFRRRWRMAWTVACTIHQQALIDACPACRATIEPHRLQATDGSLAVCATCKRSLIERKTDALEGATPALQQEADAVLMAGQGRAGSWLVPATHWFAVVRRLVGRRSVASAQRGSEEGTAEVDAFRWSTQLPFELLTVSERAFRLQAVWHELRSPHGRSLAVPSSSAHKGPPRKSPAPRQARPEGAPVSRALVSRRWARLMRRLRLPLS
jgi:hypothetical protein